MKPAIEQRTRTLRAKGMGILKIARTAGVGTSVVQRVVATRLTGLADIGEVSRLASI